MNERGLCRQWRRARSTAYRSLGICRMLVEQVINGVVLGSMYALIAQGYTLVFGVLDKLNFAHGEIFMLGGFVCLASIALGASLADALTFAVKWSD